MPRAVMRATTRFTSDLLGSRDWSVGVIGECHDVTYSSAHAPQRPAPLSYA